MISMYHTYMNYKFTYTRNIKKFNKKKKFNYILVGKLYL